MDNQHSKERADQEKYTDLLLVDLLHLDWKHFFKRYKVDFFGFLVFYILMGLVMVGTYLLKEIGN
ncbi:MAG: hypothetical protein JSU61_12485 [Fidelibacterota bacterium]|nr:MAG: hypothetical protein JSU61_12485 [Candidatus Neomarinimicrobiota bacterium]